jgi:hypothetical protein
MAVAVFPTSVRAQIVTHSFDELRLVPSVGQLALITDETDRSPLTQVAVGAESRSQGNEWQRVDALRSGTRIAVTLKSGKNRIVEFRRATADDVTIAVGREGSSESIREETLPKSFIVTAARYDPA